VVPGVWFSCPERVECTPLEHCGSVSGWRGLEWDVSLGSVSLQAPVAIGLSCLLPSPFGFSPLSMCRCVREGVAVSVRVPNSEVLVELFIVFDLSGPG
jgi:hypothetical protein